MVWGTVASDCQINHLKRLIEFAVVESEAVQIERHLAEVRSPDYPGERLIVCHNPLLAEQALLTATEEALARIARQVETDPHLCRRETRPLKNRFQVASTPLSP